MKQLLVAAGRICAEDEVADAVLEHERTLTARHRTETVVIPVFVNEGDTYCELVLGNGTLHGTLALPGTSGRRVAGSADALRELRARILAARDEAPALSAERSCGTSRLESDRTE